MKTLAKIFTLIVVLNSGMLMKSEQVQAQGASVSFQLFYDQLSPYGSWIEDPAYGYVWIPNAGPDFYPYGSEGYWLLTNLGWTWVSNYPWGWAAFHYGRWNFNTQYGWYWIPDVEWGPAWVIWRWGNGYYGWTPLTPGLTLTVAFYRANTIPYDRWLFVRNRDFDHHNVYHFCERRTNNYIYIQKSTVNYNTRFDPGRRTTYVIGPRSDEFRRHTGRTVREVVIRDYDRPGHYIGNGQYRFYRPVVQKSVANGRRPAPGKYMKSNDYRKQHERPSNPPAGKKNEPNKGEHRNYQQPGNQGNNGNNGYKKPENKPQNGNNNTPNNQGNRQQNNNRNYHQPNNQPQNGNNNQPGNQGKKNEYQNRNYRQPNNQPPQNGNNNQPGNQGKKNEYQNRNYRQPGNQGNPNNSYRQNEYQKGNQNQPAGNGENRQNRGTGQNRHNNQPYKNN